MYETIFLQPFFEEIISLYRGSFAEKSISLSVTIDSTEAGYADRSTLAVIFRNLLSNAVKFTARGGTVQILAIRQNDLVQVSVRDTGVGMDDERLATLFMLTERKSALGTEKKKRQGLASVWCKSLCNSIKEKFPWRVRWGRGLWFWLSCR